MPLDTISKVIEKLQGVFDLLLDDSMTLPQHEGPLILILGGSAMLAFSLFASLILQSRRWAEPAASGTPRRTAYPHERHHRKMLAAQQPANQWQTQPKDGVRARPGGTPPPARSPPQVRRSWIRVLKRACRQAGLGRPRHLIAPGGRHALEVKHCRSCRNPQHERDGCRWEQITLENALREHAPEARVVEVACDPSRGQCRFEILPGGSS